MKYMVISDIHGSVNNIYRVLDIYSEEKCSKLLILGDLFNYRIDFNKSTIIDILNDMKDSIVCVSGNCDYNTKGIEFDMPSIYNLKLNNKNITITHGHIYNTNKLLEYDSDIFYIGHSHIAKIDIINNKIIANPGSISKARRGENSFIITDEKSITIRNLNNEILYEYFI